MPSRTALHDRHTALGARMFEFGGWDMPLWYSSIGEEHQTVRESVGIFDASHMGKLLITDWDDELNHLITRNLKRCLPGKCVYAHLLDGEGRSLDDLIVTKLTDESHFIVCNASTRKKVIDWVSSYRKSSVLKDMTMEYSCLAVQGPKAPALISSAIGDSVLTLKRYHAIQARLHFPESAPEAIPSIAWADPIKLQNPSREGGIPAFVSRTGYTGEDGFEIFTPVKYAAQAWDQLLNLGEKNGIRPIGLGARDTLRLEMCYLLSGHDFDGSQTPLQADAEFAIDWDHEFIGKSALEAQKGGEYSRLIAYESLDRGVPRDGYPLLSPSGDRIGRTTSGTMSPSLKIGIGMGYVPQEHSPPGTELLYEVGGRMLKAKVVAKPFLKRGSKE